MALFSQSAGADIRIKRIQQEIDRTPDSKDKIELYYRFSRELRRIAPQIALNYAKEAVELANRYKINQGLAYSTLGSRYINLEQYPEAIEAINQAAKFNVGDEFVSMRAKNYESLGHSYQQLKNPTKAIENYEKYLWLNKQLNDRDRMAIAYNKIGEVYFTQNNYTEALKSFQEALNLARQLGNQTDVVSLQRNIAICEARLSNSSAGELKNAKIEALEFQEKYEIVRDSLLEAQRLVEETTAELREREGELVAKREEIKKKEEEILTLEEARALISTEKKRQEEMFLLAMGSAAILLIAALSISILAYSRYRIKKKSNQQLATINRELEAKNIEIEKAKQRSEDLLLNILPAEVARELIVIGRVEPKKYAQATMLFTDFKGFTKIAELMPPEKLIQELNRCFEAFDEICDRYHLEKIKTIGDAYMAAGGIPLANDTHAFDVVNAALEMQAYMKRWKEEKEASGEPFWELRIGIHTGAVIAGVIGKNKFAYDIWGDAVNVASRMEGAGEAWMINISADTFRKVRREFACVHRGQIPIKNKGPVDMYFVEPKIE